MDWWECGDIKVYDDAGEVLYSGPKFVRCEEWGCRSIVTDGQIKAHGACKCGNRRFRVCMKLTAEEKRGLLEGKYPLSEWEAELIFGKHNIYLPDATFGKGATQ